MMILKTVRILLCLYLFHATVNCVDIDSNACLKAHNDKRKLHGANALTWDADLAKHASDWAKELVKLGKMQHSTNRPGEGENLFWGSRSKGAYDCATAVQNWYDEVKDYPFNNPPKKLSDVPGKAIGHFTQVVWKSTTKVGVGAETKVNNIGQEETYIVARYSPPGNYQGQYAANVGNYVNASSFMCFSCTDCENTNQKGVSCPSGSDRCLIIYSGKNLNPTERSCSNQKDCEAAKKKCEDDECEAFCCGSSLCDAGAVPSFNVLLVSLCSLFAAIPFYK